MMIVANAKCGIPMGNFRWPALVRRRVGARKYGAGVEGAGTANEFDVERAAGSHLCGPRSSYGFHFSDATSTIRMGSPQRLQFLLNELAILTSIYGWIASLRRFR
jgi:hypothetical protein